MLRNQPEIDGSYLQNHGSHIRVEAESHVTQDCLPHLQNKTTTKTKQENTRKKEGFPQCQLCERNNKVS